MDRRDFIRTAAIGVVGIGVAGEAAGAGIFYPTNVEQKLFENVNRAKDPKNLTPTEKKHVPVITAPSKVEAGKPFTVEVSVGETVHPMGPTHWIEYIELSIGNEPAGRVDFQSKGYLNPKASFTVVLTKESAPSGKVTIVANERCNLHGYWEGSRDVTVE